MSQNDLGTLLSSATSGTQLASLLRNWRDALHTMHAGAARPAYVQPGMLWLKNNATPWVANLWTGTIDVPIFTVNPDTGAIGAYTKAESDARYPRLDGENAGPLGAFRNKLINTHQHINLRGYVSNTATTAASQYTIDRWRVVVSGQRLTWTMDAAGVPTYTAPAGGVEQAVEAINVEPGIYTLSWEGTATATISGTAVAKGAQVNLNGQTTFVVRFAGGTFRLPQLERGTIATAAERRPLQVEQILAARYFQLFDASASGHYPTGNSGATAFGSIYLPVLMRGQPTIAQGEDVQVVNIGTSGFTAAPSGRSIRYTITQGASAGNFLAVLRNYRADAEF